MHLTEPAGVYRLFEEHFERYVREYEERYEAREGAQRSEGPNVERATYVASAKRIESTAL